MRKFVFIVIIILIIPVILSACGPSADKDVLYVNLPGINTNLSITRTNRVFTLVPGLGLMPPRTTLIWPKKSHNTKTCMSLSI
jgi:hypothetical protein